MNIYIDIETLRSPEEHRLQILEDVKANFKAPSGLTKGVMAKDLGLDDKEAKFIGAGDMKTRWESEMAETKSADIAQAKWEKTSFDPEVAPIACICVDVFDNKKSFDLVSFDNERKMLAAFHLFIKEVSSACGYKIRDLNFIGHYINKFDLPFIWKRSVINNVSTCEGVKWIDTKHGVHCFDTMTAWAGYGGSISMDKLAGLLGIEGKGDIDGSMVYDTWQKDPQKVIDYCHDDVSIVKAIHERLTK